tara:strand:- start:158 stop:715 length:558 start_codon:yes stop_codon:yes gene_type:complete
MSNRTMSGDEVFISWKSQVKEIGKVRYTAVERKEQLDELCEMFLEFGVDFDEAKSYKKRILEFMVTKEGMKGNGKHKGWKEATEEDFVGLLVGWYRGDFQVVNDTKLTKKAITKKIEYYGGLDYMDRTPLMVAWTKHKFKDNWSEAVCLEAHKIGSSLWRAFGKEVLSSKWAKTGPRPEWAKNIF